jgi:hypothetical protein
MTAPELPANGMTQTASSPYSLLLPAFFATILMSAALLFAVQPMFTKMVLPRLGGAAAVWSVAMVFFQATLLAGYAYAHLLTRFAPGRVAVLIHLSVLLIASCKRGSCRPIILQRATRISYLPQAISEASSRSSPTRL